MKVGIVGGGKMGQEVKKRLERNFEIWVYDKKPELANCSIDQLKNVDIVLLLVPGEYVVSAIKELTPYLSPDHILVNMATGINVSEINAQLQLKNHLGAAKIIGHVGVMREEGRDPLIAVQYDHKEVLSKIREVLQWIGEIIELSEHLVSEINKMGTIQGMKSAQKLLGYMKNEELNAQDQEKILKSYFELVALGSARAYLRGEMGPFAKKLLDEEL